MAKTNRVSAATARRLERQREAIELRRAGKSYREIADRMGVSISTAHGLVMAGIAEIRQHIEDDATTLLAEEISRLDALLQSVWPDARKGHLGAVDRVLRIMERRAKLLGLDAPAAVAHTSPDGSMTPRVIVVQGVGPEHPEASTTGCRRTVQPDGGLEA